MVPESLYVMNALEITLGYVFGQLHTPRSEHGRRGSMRSALEGEMRGSLLRAPCGVAFSGGRDSALVLAVATHVARSEGLANPVPITRRFQAPEAEESEWQELVVRHLGLTEWVRIELTDELDVVGPLAAAHLRQHGVVWPPPFASDLPLLDVVRGGAILDGEGGDQVLEVGAHRAAPLADLVREPRPLRRLRVQAAIEACAPAYLRAPRTARRQLTTFPRPWLRPAGNARLLDALDSVERDRPLSYSASVRSVLNRRAETLAGHNRSIVAERYDVTHSSPLLSTGFVHALARDGRLLGRRDRTTVLRAIAGDLLPDAVLSRTTKASFNSCYFARYSREFAERWTGAGVDPELVDAERLREAWLVDRPFPSTAALLQAAWIASGPPSSRDRNVAGVARSGENRPTLTPP